MASITDWLDGYLARRRKQVTALGQVIDPLADKLLTSAASSRSFRWARRRRGWWRSSSAASSPSPVSAASLYARGVAIPASQLGKIKMVAQVVAILALILGRHGTFFLVIGHAAMWVVLVAALVSAADYFRRFSLQPSPVTDIAVAREQRSGRRVG